MDEKSEVNETQQPVRIGTSAWHWFGRGLVGGLLLIAAFNSISYFFRSDINNLFVPKFKQSSPDAVGFPFEVWNSNKTYTTGMIDFIPLSWNILVGVLLGTAFGIIGVLGRRHFNRWVIEFEEQERSRSGFKLQFSIKNILIITSLVAATSAAITTWGSSPIVLGVIYFLGPLVLILVAMSPDQMRWQYRATILVALAFVMFAVAINTGNNLGKPFDEVMFGIFVSWPPQSGFAALAIVIGLLVQIWRQSSGPPAEESSQANRLSGE